jgi:hypothetical protein
MSGTDRTISLSQAIRIYKNTLQRLRRVTFHPCDTSTPERRICKNGTSAYRQVVVLSPGHQGFHTRHPVTDNIGHFCPNEGISLERYFSTN